MGCAFGIVSKVTAKLKLLYISFYVILFCKFELYN